MSMGRGGDGIIIGRIPDADVVVGVACTTELCQKAKATRGLAPTSAIALGRLMTATALAGLFTRNEDTLSLQITCDGRLRHLFADVTPEGAVRGFVKNRRLALPLFPGETVSGRRSIVAGIVSGTLSVIRAASRHEFTQSSTDLVTGEIDGDVEHFLNASEQIPSVVLCDVRLDEDAQVHSAGGLIAQCLPGGSRGRLESLRTELVQQRFADLLAGFAADPVAALSSLVPDSRCAQRPIPLSFECRCAADRVVTALRSLPATDLAEMVVEKEAPEVQCDFCGQKYVVDPRIVERLYLDGITAVG